MEAEQRMTSLDIAQVTGKMHKDVLKAIRNMEPAWLKVNGRHFALVDYKDSKGELRPCITEDRIESNLSKTKNIPPKAVIFSDFCCIFAMPLMIFACLDLQH